MGLERILVLLEQQESNDSSENPDVYIVVSGDDAVTRLRQLVGATNPANANPGSVRYVYGSSLQENAVHASDSDASAERELGIIFGA